MQILARFPDLAPEPSPAALQALPEEAAVVVPASASDASGGRSLRQPLAERLGRLVSPRRRGLRQIRAGWGSIGFLAMLAAGIWSFAWWQDRQAAEQARDAAAPQVAAAPLEAADQLVR